jgi:hypothetical protein
MKVKPNIKEDVISFPTAKLAHKANFIFKGRTNDWINTSLPYHEDGTRTIDFTYKCELYPAPPQGLLQKWFRLKHNLLIEVNYRTFGVSSGNGYFYMVERKGKHKNMDNYMGKTVFEGFKTYEDALEVGLQQACKLIINKNKIGKYYD